MPHITDTFDDALDDDETFDTPWSLDDLDRSADLGSVRTAWAGCNDGNDF
jgi:hypothetical protein